MPGIRFGELAERFIGELETAGATVLTLPRTGDRPLVLSVSMEGSTYLLEVYLWAVTPGGKGRGRPTERRIQMTGVDRFTLKAGVRTIIGGWSEETGAYAFWDVRRHLTFTAGSPSLQIDLSTLERAHLVGMATEARTVREGNEVAIAVQADYLLWYIKEYENLYDSAGEIPNAAELIESHPEEERAFIDAGATDHAQARRHKIVSVVQAFRDARFRPMVLRAYSYRCCLSGVSLRLVDAAHIVPVSDPQSTDDPQNGLALNPLLHRAYDNGLLGILPGGKTAINQRVLDRLTQSRVGEGMSALRSLIPPVMTMPGSPELRPHDDYLKRGLTARGWSLEEILAAAG